MRIIPADMFTLERMKRDTDLRRMMIEEQTVNIYNPLAGGVWEGFRIVGLLEEPGMLVEATGVSPTNPAGYRLMLPQAFRIENFEPRVKRVREEGKE